MTTQEIIDRLDASITSFINKGQGDRATVIAVGHDLAMILQNIERKLDALQSVG